LILNKLEEKVAVRMGMCLEVWDVELQKLDMLRNGSADEIFWTNKNKHHSASTLKLSRLSELHSKDTPKPSVV
jgi:hypothetical protein